ncbi:MAG: alanine racemase [Wenzhouxiangellaceae bacterium]
MSRDTIAQIDLSALSHNLERVRELAPGSRVMAVVKADAYGHGLVRTARALAATDMYAVATLEEALALRRAGLAHPILLLEGFHRSYDLPLIQQHNLEVVVHNQHQLQALSDFPSLNLRRAWLKLDTGMHRLGFRCTEGAAVYRHLQALNGVHEVGLMTHFACADEPQHPLNQAQLAAFDSAIAGLAGPQSLANSAALVNLPGARRDWVRSGIMLYGVSPNPGQQGSDLGLKPVMTLSSRLIAVHQLEAGESVGYGAAYQCPQAMRIGIAAIGYGDGYPRHAANGAPVLIRGRKSALVGRVSMDMIAVDLRGIDEAVVGDRVVLWGEGLAVESVARHADAIPYQLLCGITSRVTSETVSRAEADAALQSLPVNSYLRNNPRS